MALFSRKKPSETAEAAGEGFTPQPEKARQWFEHARTYADTGNFEGALRFYAIGVKLDPDAMSAHEAMYDAAVKYLNSGGKPASGKEIRELEDSNPVSKFAAAEFAWMKDIMNASLALKTLEAAIKAGQIEYGNWSASRVLNILRKGKKVSKSSLVQAKDMFKQVSAWNEALAAGQLAMQLDPSDNELDHELKDISAQRAMDQGGYERAAGQEGGFRTFVKDAEKQRELTDRESIAAGASVEERNLARAKQAYEATPHVPDAINTYAQLIKKQGTRAAEEEAYRIYMQGFEATSEYRFRMAAGDIRIDQARREVDALEAKSAGGESDAIALAASRKRLSDLEAAEYAERVEKYPTNREMRLRLGEVEFARGNFEEAMASFQAAKDDPKLRVRAGHMLGRCFAAEGWHLEAVSEYKEALQGIEATTERERELAIRYDLMLSLIEEARRERNVDNAREALEICSGIARKNITYRDIRAKRKEIDELIREL